MRKTGDVIPVTYARTIVRRALLIWLLTRVVVAGIGVAAKVGLQLTLSPVTILLLAAVVAVLADVDARVMREPLFYANLGTPAWLNAALAGAIVLCIETAITIVVVLA
jgi:hypothetical protein